MRKLIENNVKQTFAFLEFPFNLVIFFQAMTNVKKVEFHFPKARSKNKKMENFTLQRRFYITDNFKCVESKKSFALSENQTIFRQFLFSFHFMLDYILFFLVFELHFRFSFPFLCFRFVMIPHFSLFHSLTLLSSYFLSQKNYTLLSFCLFFFSV